MKILTQRLEIQPLNSQWLEIFAVSPTRLSGLLHLDIPLMPLTEHMQRVYKLKASRIEADPKSLLYHTYYLILTREGQSDQPRAMIGFIGLKGEPDQDGNVEVGYHVFEPYRNRGYMKEALMGFSNWLMQFKEVSCIDACTSHVNYSSQHVLAACGYELIARHKDLWVWRFTAI